MDDSSHREHAWWHDYKERGIYLITIVVKNRQHLFGELNNDVHNPDVVLSDLGKAVQREWFNTIDIQQSKGRDISALGSVVMPDHFHGILFVKQSMDICLGEIIRCFKIACTQARNRLLSSQPCMADLPDKPLSRMSHQQRETYYDQHPNKRPLFDDNFDDSICSPFTSTNCTIYYVYSSILSQKSCIFLAKTNYFSYLCTKFSA